MVVIVRNKSFPHYQLHVIPCHDGVFMVVPSCRHKLVPPNSCNLLIQSLQASLSSTLNSSDSQTLSPPSSPIQDRLLDHYFLERVGSSS